MVGPLNTNYFLPRNLQVHNNSMNPNSSKTNNRAAARENPPTSGALDF